MGNSWFAPARLSPHRKVITTTWITYWVILFGLTHAPKLPPSPIQLSKRGLAAHFIAYGLLAAGCVLTRRSRGLDVTYGWLGGWLIVFALYAALDELLQPLTNRSCDLLDWLANMAGVLVVFAMSRPKRADRENA